MTLIEFLLNDNRKCRLKCILTIIAFYHYYFRGITVCGLSCIWVASGLSSCQVTDWGLVLGCEPSS
jgi:uncharacterized membrane protein (DUF485 family)